MIKNDREKCRNDGSQSKIDHGIISVVILLLPLIQEVQLPVTDKDTSQISVTTESVHRLTDRLNMTLTMLTGP